MISYAPLWKTMEAKGISTYTLINHYGIDARTVFNLKHNKSVTMFTLGKLCQALGCTPNDVVEFLSAPDTDG